ncbi:MAG: helix-turn-helix domain-containing protein [Mucilaginibacter sp.]
MERKEKIKSDFARELKKIRTAKGLTIRKLAGSAGLEYSHVQRIEKGLVDVALTTIHALAEGLEVEPGLLLQTSEHV